MDMSIIEKTKSLIANMNEDFAGNMLFALIIIIIILSTVYFSYLLKSLSKATLSSECSLLTLNGSIKSLNNADPNCQLALRDYYIKSAYNCCSSGSYKNNFVSICALKNVLRQGVRGLDFEIYSVDQQPVVSTSTENNYYIKETYNSISFDEVMSTIANYAFSNSTCPNPNDPIIFHFRFKSANQNMYQTLADIFKQYDSYFLGPETSNENSGKNIGNTLLLSLNKKIVVIVDKLNNSFMDNKDFFEYVNMTSNSIFMRALNYYDVKNTPDLVELQEYNKPNMSISMPDANQTYPENPSAIICRETGCQMISMMYQQNDINLQENNAFFDKCGYAFCLKPERLRYIPITIPDPIPQNPALSYATRTVKSDYYAFNI